MDMTSYLAKSVQKWINEQKIIKILIERLAFRKL